MFLVDKYQLKVLDDIEFHQNLYKKLLGLDTLKEKNISDDHNEIFNNMPHILFYGPSGSGKKTMINLLLKTIFDKSIFKTQTVNYSISGYGNNNINIDIKQSNHHIIIEPTNSGFDKYLIQEIVKEYAKKKVLNVFNSKKKFKIVLINNVDNLSYYAQTSLRCTMEKYVKTCKFILCGYQVTKIIDPLKSRCLCIRVPTPSNDHIFLTLFKISVKEKRNLSLDKYNYILDKCNNNIKNALWMLELSFYNIPIEWSWKNSISQIVKIILNSSKVKINTSHIESIRSILYTIFITNISGINILKELLYQLLENIDNENIRSETINIVSKHEHSLACGKRSIIHLESFIYNIMYMISCKM